MGACGAGVGGPCGVSAMVCHSDVYHGSLVAAAAACDPGSAGSGRCRGKLDLIRDISRLNEAQTLTGLRRDVRRIGEFDLLLLEIGDLAAQRGFGGGQLFHLGALREISANRAGDGERQHADNRRQDRGPPSGQAQPLL